MKINITQIQIHKTDIHNQQNAAMLKTKLYEIVYGVLILLFLYWPNVDCTVKTE